VQQEVKPYHFLEQLLREYIIKGGWTLIESNNEERAAYL
jgi:hypothetical protein